MPDNLTWTPDGKILAAGIKGINGNCPSESSYPCMQGFVLAEVDAKTMESRIVYDNSGKALINGVSVAIGAGDASYVGFLQGNRIPKLPREQRIVWRQGCSWRPGILALYQTPAVI